MLAEDGEGCQGIALRPQGLAPTWPGSMTPVTGAPHSNPTAMPQCQVPEEFVLVSDHWIEVVLAGRQASGSRGTGLTLPTGTATRGMAHRLVLSGHCLHHPYLPLPHDLRGIQILDQFSHMVSSCQFLILVSLHTFMMSSPHSLAAAAKLAGRLSTWAEPQHLLRSLSDS